MGLDRSRHFGESIPPTHHKYIQDGKFFDVDGNEVTVDGRPAAVKQVKVDKAEKPAPAAEADPEVAAQLKA